MVAKKASPFVTIKRFSQRVDEAIETAEWNIEHAARLKQMIYIGHREAFKAVISLIEGDENPIDKLSSSPIDPNEFGTGDDPKPRIYGEDKQANGNTV